MNRTVISLLAEALGAGGKREKPLHHDLDALAGSWTREEASAFERTLARQRPIAPDLWK